MAREFKTKEIRGTRTVGERLRIARRRRKLTLEEAEIGTKIRLKYLEAFERGLYSELPSEVYTLGFLRRYGEYLRLDTDSLTELFKTEWKSASANQANKGLTKGDFSPTSTVPRWQFFITPRSALIVLVAVFVIGLFGYIWWSVHNFSAPPKLLIQAPTNETTVTDDNLIIKGQTDPGAFIFINQESINVDQNGNFQQQVNLNSGVETIVVEAKNRLDRQSLKTIKILTDATNSSNQTTTQ